MQIETFLLLYWLALAIVFTGLWAFQCRVQNAGLVDVGWAWTYGLGSLAALLAFPQSGAWRWLPGVLILAWSGRLGLHILQRYLRHAAEDPRYANLRKAMPGQAGWFAFYQGQAVANVILILPWVVVLKFGQPGWGWAVGALLIAVAIAGEAVADRQLEAWKADPNHSGKTCRRGLWAWSRHPNYFFEWLKWLSYPCLGFSLLTSGQEWLWLLTWLSPLLMYVLLTRITGIPYTEKRALASRGEDYRRYQATVSRFFPLPPRSDAKALPG